MPSPLSPPRGSAPDFGFPWEPWAPGRPAAGIVCGRVWLFRGDTAGGCAFLLAEITADSLTIEDLEAGRRLGLAPHARRLLELEIEPAEAVSGFAVETPELVGVG